jgi:hypothetical protein
VVYEPLWPAITTFRLAERMVQYQMYSENAWCGRMTETFDEPLADVLILQKDEMKRLLATLHGQVRDNAVQALISQVSECLEAAWQDFLHAFHGDERRRRVEKLEAHEPEDPNFDQAKYLLRGWPLRMKPWFRFIEALSGVLKTLSVVDRLCYRVSETISFGLYLHATNPNGRSQGLPPASYLAARLAPKLRKLSESLGVKIGQLKSLDFDVSEDAYSRSNRRVRGYPNWVYGKLEILNKGLPELIKKAAIKHDKKWGIGQPFWDNKYRELRYQGQVIKRFRNDATSQLPIVQAFQKAKWPMRIDTPTIRENRTTTAPGRARRRRLDAIRDLNEGICPKLLKFSSDGTGRGIQWEPCCFATPAMGRIS